MEDKNIYLTEEFEEQDLYDEDWEKVMQWELSYE